MKNEFKIKTDIYHILKGSDLIKNVSGKLSKTVRPDSSNNEDVVISVLSDPGAVQIEEVYVNVNVYVPDVKRGNQYEENTLRLDQLCELSINALKSVIGNSFRVSLATQKTYEVPGKNEHFINNKVLYQICNEV
jgi:hypothetical protein